MNLWDPSGQMTLVEAQAVVADLGTLVRLAQPIIRAYNTATAIVDMVNMVAGIAKLLQTGGLDAWLIQVTDEIGRVVRKRGIGFSAEEAAEQFGLNFASALPYAGLWAPPLVADIASGAKFTGYTVFGPNFVGSNNGVSFPTGLKVGGHPVTFTLGGEYSGRLAGIGIQTEKAGKKINHLFYRMDIHEFHLTRAGGTGGATAEELTAPWRVEPFHFHVMKYFPTK